MIIPCKYCLHTATAARCLAMLHTDARVCPLPPALTNEVLEAGIELTAQAHFSDGAVIWHSW